MRSILSSLQAPASVEPAREPWGRQTARSAETPPQFLDPVTSQIMTDPVLVCSTGQTYDRTMLQRWIDRSLENGRLPTDPGTGVQITGTPLVRARDARVRGSERRKGSVSEGESGQADAGRARDRSEA